MTIGDATSSDGHVDLSGPPLAPEIEGRSGPASQYRASGGPVQSAQVLSQVSQQLAQILTAGDGSVTEVRLDPEELGHLRIAFSTRDGVMHISLSAERWETLDLLKRHAGELSLSLSDMGFGAHEFSFSQSHAEPEHSEHETSRQNYVTADAEMPLASQTITTIVLPSDGIDIRL